MNSLQAACAALLSEADATTGAPSSAPWLAPYIAVSRGVAQQVQTGVAVAQALNAAAAGSATLLGAGQALHFAPADDAPPGVPYESHVAATGRVPTRDTAHDLYNGLVWLRFPTIKKRLNALQAGAIAAAGVAAPRGRLRDALTLFDENAALLQAPPALLEPLAARDWHLLFVGQREQWRDVRLIVFGHALLEKLLQPRKAITAHVWVLDSDRELQAAALHALEPRRMAAKPWLVLPLLGVPGWCNANADAAYYADAAVFRTPPAPVGAARR